MSVVVRPVDSEGEALFHLEDGIRKKREEVDEKVMEKYVQIEANYQAKRLPKLRRGNDAQRRQGARRKRRGRGKRKN